MTTPIEDSIKGSEFLLRVLETAREQGSMEIAALVDLEGRLGVAFSLLVLSVATMVPLPGPFAVLFGGGMMFVAAQMVAGVDRLWLPQMIGRRRLSLKVVEAVVKYGRPWVLKLERRLTSGRLAPLTGKAARALLGVPVLLLAFLIALPIPFGNMLPAFSIILIAIALAERDGLVVIAALALTIAASFVSWHLALASHKMILGWLGM